MLAEIETGYLESVEKQASAARIDRIRRDALEDFADGKLNGGAVFWEWKVKVFVLPAPRRCAT